MHEVGGINSMNGKTDFWHFINITPFIQKDPKVVNEIICPIHLWNYVHNNSTFCLRVKGVSKRYFLQDIPRRLKLFWTENNNHCMFINLHFRCKAWLLSLKFPSKKIPGFCLFALFVCFLNPPSSSWEKFYKIEQYQM